MQKVQLAAGRALQQVLGRGRNLNQVLEQTLSGKTEWTASQRGALQDMSYGALRFYGQLQAILDRLLHKPLSDERVRYLLLVALYQLQHSKSAPHAVVDHAVRAAQELNPGTSGLVNAILRNFLRSREALIEQAAQTPAGKFSYPKWWIDELSLQYGQRSSAILEAGNLHPPMTLRVNRRLCAVGEYAELLAQHGLEAHRILPEALQLFRPVAVEKLPGFFDGLVSVQDAGAQFAAQLLDLQEGMRVLDACAAPGGKTAHALEIANVEMSAVDKDEQRLQRVYQNLQRLNLKAQVIVGDAAHPEGWWDGRTFQRILADVPCSASGVVRRHPDIKWLRRAEDIAGFASQQRAILGALWPLLAQGGKLLYATCSVFEQENERVVSDFLALHQDARRLPVILPDNSEGQLLPDEQHDGFFYALLQKTA